ncbi:hypothetical protein BKA65DRAFT_489491 [Rhexocercosporidium sp. MPI-PUGE-AT-0058]|nr:hypothetical protein BKA65DRAFT_489491 [Rhexocercosporidium sp. MPI-PUGE-AT-0058]
MKRVGALSFHKAWVTSLLSLQAINRALYGIRVSGFLAVACNFKSRDTTPESFRAVPMAPKPSSRRYTISLFKTNKLSRI